MAYSKLKGNDLAVAEALEKNIKNLMNEMNIETQAELMQKIKEKKGYVFNQPTLSALLNHNKKASLNELIALSDFFNVSIDYLLGRENISKKLTISEICKLIVQLQESGSNMKFKKVRIDNIAHDGFDECQTPFYNNYNAFYFSEYIDVPFSVLPYEKEKAYIVNKFIEKLLQLNNVKDIDKDIYNDIIARWINKLKKYDDETTLEESNNLYFEL